MPLKHTQKLRLKKIVANDSAVLEERRDQPRIQVRLMATVILNNEPHNRSRSYSVCAEVVNVSKKGAMIACSEPLEGETIYVRFLVDGAGPNVIQSKIVHTKINPDRANPYRYGIEFHRLLSDDRFAELLQNTLTDHAVYA